MGIHGHAHPLDGHSAGGGEAVLDSYRSIWPPCVLRTLHRTMATKLKKQQKKKRWEGAGLSFPPELRAEVRTLRLLLLIGYNAMVVTDRTAQAGQSAWRAVCCALTHAALA